MKRAAGWLVGVALLALASSWLVRRHPTSPAGIAGAAPRAPAPALAVPPSPPRFVSSLLEEAAPRPGAPARRYPPEERSGFLVKAAAIEAGPAPRAAHRALTVEDALEQYRTEICACQDERCAEECGLKYGPIVADADHRGSDPIALATLKKSVVKCLDDLTAGRLAPR
jgi:hypothetical protein